MVRIFLSYGSTVYLSFRERIEGDIIPGNDVCLGFLLVRLLCCSSIENTGACHNRSTSPSCAGRYCNASELSTYPCLLFSFSFSFSFPFSSSFSAFSFSRLHPFSFSLLLLFRFYFCYIAVCLSSVSPSPSYGSSSPSLNSPTPSYTSTPSTTFTPSPSIPTPTSSPSPLPGLLSNREATALQDLCKALRSTFGGFWSNCSDAINACIHPADWGGVSCNANSGLVTLCTFFVSWHIVLQSLIALIIQGFAEPVSRWLYPEQHWRSLQS